MRRDARARKRAITLVLVAITIASFIGVTFRLRLEPNIASLLPERGESAALRRYVRGFGGGDLAVVMVKGPDAAENAAVAAKVAEELGKRPSVKVAADRGPSIPCWLGGTRTAASARGSPARSRPKACERA
jgi:uncharacterized protein